MQGGGRDFRKCMLRLPATPDQFSFCLRFKNLLRVVLMKDVKCWPSAINQLEVHFVLLSWSPEPGVLCTNFLSMRAIS